MIKSKLLRKALSVVMSVAVIGTTLVTGGTASATASDPLISNETYAGNAGYIKTFYKSEYLNGGNNAFELKYQYTKLGTVAENDDLGYNNSLQFVVFDSEWGGWEPTTIGPNGYDKTEAVTPELNKTYTVTVPFSVIEEKLSTGKQVLGINIQTGGISDCTIKIDSLSYISEERISSPVVIEGAWHKTGNAEDTEADFGTMSVKSGSAYVSTNAWNIGVSGLDVDDFNAPIVAVTVEYGEITNGPIYPQAEILDSSGQPIVQNYPQVSAAGDVTYLTSIPETTQSMTLAYDTCTVKKVEIYDEDEDYSTTKNDLTNDDIIDAMGAGWNLGNALDAVTEQGVTSETAWGNPVINKRTFKDIAAAGFKTVRIPVSWVDAVTVNGDTYTINETRFNAILARVKQVVDMARDYDLFVIINLQHDGSEGVTGQWLDIDASNQTGIRAAFAEVWRRIAEEFQCYDQHLIFESMNEVMENGNYGTPSDTTWANINYLNQSFVNVVRALTCNNPTRFLLVPGYNTNIEQTLTDKFVMPTYNGSTDRIMVSVHYYDPYNFTLNTGEGSETTVTPTDLTAIAGQFGELKTKFVDNGIPVIIGEFGAVDKNNHTAIKTYITRIVNQAKQKGLGYIYWDNGYTGENGMGLWNRYTYAQSELGKVLIPILTAK